MVDHRANSRPVALQVKGSFLGLECCGAENCVERVAEHERRVQVATLVERRRGADALLQVVEVPLISAQDGCVCLTGRVCVQDNRGVEREHSPKRRPKGWQGGGAGDERQRPLGCIASEKRAEFGDKYCQVIRLMTWCGQQHQVEVAAVEDGLVLNEDGSRL
jgi:hypothetical protein